MTKIHMLIGLPASGKSTLVKEKFSGFPIVSKDLCNGSESEERRQLEQLLASGKEVVVDDTNYNKETRRKIFELARKYGAEVEGYYITTEKDECLVRNETRENKVPSIAIHTLAKKFEQPKMEEGFSNINVIDYLGKTREQNQGVEQEKLGEGMAGKSKDKNRKSNMTLELIVRNGNPEGVKLYASSVSMDNEEEARDKFAEAGIYSEMKLMWQESDGGIDSSRVNPVLSQKHIGNYLAKTRNTEMLIELVDVLIAGTNAGMEEYAQITAIDVFALPEVSRALRNNLSDGKLNQKVRELVKGGYSLVFSHCNIDAGMVKHYFPLIDKWRDFINPREVVKEAIDGLSEESMLEQDYQREFLYAALEKLVELSDKKTVSGLIFENFERGDYAKLVRAGKIVPYEKRTSERERVKCASEETEKAIRKFESDNYPSQYQAKDFVNAIKKDDKAKEYISSQVGVWFSQGKIRHVESILTQIDSLNIETVRKSLTGAIAEASLKKSYARLDRAMTFPEEVIDLSNPKIEDFAQAYAINRKTKPKMEMDVY